MTLLQHHLLALSLIFITTLTLSILLLWKNPRRFTNQIFALYTFSLTWWSLWEFLTQLAPNEAIATFRLRMEYPGVCFIPTLFYHGIVSLTGVRRKYELWVCYILSAIFTIFITILRHPAFLPEALPISYLLYWGRAGSLYWLFLLFFTVTVLRVHETLWKSYHGEPPGIRRKQFQYLFFSSVIAYIAAVPEFSLKLGIQIPVLQPFGLYSVPAYILLVAYMIIQFRLFDIEVVIRKSLVYSLLVTLMTVGYFGMVYGIEQTFKTTLGYKSFWISLASFALMAFLFQPIKVAVQRMVDWLVFRSSQEHLVKKLERLEEQAFQAEKFKAVSTLAAGMAHEIKNPLTTLKTFTEYIPEKRNDPEFLQKLHEVYTAEINRIQTIVKDLLEFSKPRPPELKPVDIGPLIVSTVNLLSSDLLKRRIQWTIDCRHNGSTLQADVGQLRQVLINLIQNAADAMPAGGQLTIATQSVNSHLKLTVSDTGSGIPPALLPKIFDPFVTTKPDGNGLGLAVVYSIIQAHHGSVRADSQPNHGTTFTVTLPL
jgi:signal transduction histidine kinase